MTLAKGFKDPPALPSRRSEAKGQSSSPTCNEGCETRPARGRSCNHPFPSTAGYLLERYPHLDHPPLNIVLTRTLDFHLPQTYTLYNWYVSYSSDEVVYGSSAD